MTDAEIIRARSNRIYRTLEENPVDAAQEVDGVDRLLEDIADGLGVAIEDVAFGAADEVGHEFLHQELDIRLQRVAAELRARSIMRGEEHSGE